MYKRRAAARKPIGRRRRPALRRKWNVRRKAPSKGGFYIKRRIPAYGLQGSTTLGATITSTNTSSFILGTPVASASGGTSLWDVPFSMQFQLNQLDTSTDITNIADKYRLVNAIVKLTTSNIALGAGAGLVMPWVEYVADADDATAPSVSIISQKMGVRTTGFNQRGQVSMYVKPVPSALIYNGVTSAYAVPRRSPYIDCSNPDVPHYGIKGVLRSVFLPGTASCANFAVDVQMCVHAKDLQ